MDPFATIDPQAFTSLWYWVVLVLVLVHVSQRLLGVPRALMTRARQGDPQAQADLVALAHLRARDLRSSYAEAGMLAVALWSAALTGLAVLGFGFWFEGAQALLFLTLPLAAEQGLSLVTADRLLVAETSDAVRRALLWHLFLVHAMAFALLFCAVFWGMLFTLMQGMI